MGVPLLPPRQCPRQSAPQVDRQHHADGPASCRRCSPARAWASRQTLRGLSATPQAPSTAPPAPPGVSSVASPRWGAHHQAGGLAGPAHPAGSCRNVCPQPAQRERSTHTRGPQVSAGLPGLGDPRLPSLGIAGAFPRLAMAMQGHSTRARARVGPRCSRQWPQWGQALGRAVGRGVVPGRRSVSIGMGRLRSWSRAHTRRSRRESLPLCHAPHPTTDVTVTCRSG